MTPEERTEQSDRHLLRDPDDEDDWEWRRRIRASPRWRPVYRVAVLLVGLVMVLGGLALVPLPGPGWLIVFLGLGILATEFSWAERLLGFGRRTLRSWLHWLGRQHLAVRALVSLATLLFVVGVVGLTLQLSVGLPFVTS